MSLFARRAGLSGALAILTTLLAAACGSDEAGGPNGLDTSPGGETPGGNKDDGNAPKGEPKAPETGFRADWFDLFSTPAGTTFTKTIAIAHDDKTAPAAGVRGTLYSVRFSATITLPTEGEYAFFVTSDDGVRIFVDDEAVLDIFKSQAPTDATASIPLSAGEHELRVEYFQDVGGAKLALEWQPPGGTRGPIPEAIVRPLAEAPKDAQGALYAGPRPTFTNPVVPFDCPDPGVIAADDKGHIAFYMVCTGGPMTVRKSDDLVRWRDTPGQVIPGGKTAWSANGNRNWAPEIHKVGNKFVAYYTAVNGANVLSIGAASAPAPDGPYTDRGSPLVTHPQGVIDATFFEDTDGKRYLYYKIDGNSVGARTPIYARELAADGMSFKPDAAQVEVLNNNAATWEGGVVEAPWIVKHDGEYFLFYSGNVYDYRYRQGVAKSKSPLGPFTKKGPPILSNNAAWVGPGHGTIMTVHGRDYFFHHAWPALPNGTHDTSRGRFGLITEIQWKDGWPVLGDGTPTTTPELWP